MEPQNVGIPLVTITMRHEIREKQQWKELQRILQLRCYQPAFYLRTGNASASKIPGYINGILRGLPSFNLIISMGGNLAIVHRNQF